MILATRVLIRFMLDSRKNFLPDGESLEDTEGRVAPYWERSIRPIIQAGLSVLVVAHGNSLRALVRYLDQIPPDQVPNLDIPTGVPIIYDARLRCETAAPSAFIHRSIQNQRLNRSRGFFADRPDQDTQTRR